MTDRIQLIKWTFMNVDGLPTLVPPGVILDVLDHTYYTSQGTFAAAIKLAQSGGQLKVGNTPTLPGPRPKS
jgi:hypothetical protein